MSYCRWSSNNFKCDIYAYESDHGYEIHVASNRIVGEPPVVKHSVWMKPDITEEEKLEWKKQNEANSKFHETATHEKIGLPSDGESFTLDTLDAFRDKLLELRSEGYIFPDYVLEDIEEEKKNG